MSSAAMIRKRKRSNPPKTSLSENRLFSTRPRVSSQSPARTMIQLKILSKRNPPNPLIKFHSNSSPKYVKLLGGSSCAARVE
jgi:hypothetical protein